MMRPLSRVGTLLFFAFFVPYAVGAAVFLTAGLAPSVVKEFDGVHDAVHDFADDALLADGTVTAEFENPDEDRARRVVILNGEPGPPVLIARVPAQGRATYRFRAPAPG